MPDKTYARDFMRKQLVTVTPEMSVMDAVGVLLKNKFSGAPVLDDGGNLVGIMSELDCVNHISDAAMNGVPPKRVEDLMTRDVETVSPDATMLTLVHIFAQKRFRRVPVVDDSGRLLGQISRRDLMEALYEKMKVAQKKKDGPLYLSAVSDQAPASVFRGRKK
jgi:CBS domain-containing protein